MPKFSANISMMFGEVDFLDRFEAAGAAGFKAIEFLFPYDYAMETIARKVKENSLEISVFNLPPGNWEAGDRGQAALSDRQAEFTASIKPAIEYAKCLGVPRLHVMAGITQSMDLQLARDTYVRNLKHAATVCGDSGLELLIEPINQRDMPGYFLSDTRQAEQIIAEVAAPNLKLLFDVYHHQISRGDVLYSLEKYMPIIGHVQIAGVPTRHEPDEGELNYRAVFAKLDALEYAGWVGCEYRPRGETTQGLLWLSNQKHPPS